ncbi:MAG: RrF2 family transcriptional regulator [Christensenellales bacterium]
MTAEFIVAVHALVFLHHKGCCQSSEVIAENICTNPARVRKVLGKLRTAGLVEAHGRQGGGYRFLGDAGSVTLAGILEAVGENVVHLSWRSGKNCAECPISRGMGPLMDEVLEGVETACRAELGSTSLAQLSCRLFSEPITPDQICRISQNARDT